TEGVIHKDFYGNVESPFIPVNRNVIQPGEKELEQNPRSRSAKLRIAEKISD
ncbi:16S rRNA (cytosine(1402)-N(4))-methyltransferase, partial [Bacteroidota bacterium]